MVKVAEAIQNSMRNLVDVAQVAKLVNSAIGPLAPPKRLISAAKLSPLAEEPLINIATP